MRTAVVAAIIMAIINLVSIHGVSSKLRKSMALQTDINNAMLDVMQHTIDQLKHREISFPEVTADRSI